jgi:transcriptional regulator GlxA family with amidase domain
VKRGVAGTSRESRGAERIDIVFVVPSSSLLLDIAGPAEAFRLSNQHLLRRGDKPRFRLRFAGPKPQCASSVGLQLAELEPLPTELPVPTWVVLVGQPSAAIAKPDPSMNTTMRWLGHTLASLLASDTRHRLVTICSGSLLAARAGLLGTRRCTTHHELLAELHETAPAAQVVDNRVFVVDGTLASSAGVTAGIDLALHLIATTCDDRTAASVAQDMVVYLRRTPNDLEVSPMLAHRNHLHPAVHRVQDAICADPTREWTMPSLADVGHVTERHLLRLFTSHAAVSPLSYLQAIRLERAKQNLSRGASVTRAAQDAGFASDLQLRRAWRQRFADTPSAGRKLADRPPR